MPTEDHFAQAVAELTSDAARPGLMGMAEVEAEGDPARTRAAYIRLRAQQLADEYRDGDLPLDRPAAAITPANAGRSTNRVMLIAGGVGLLGVFLAVASTLSSDDSSAFYSESTESIMPLPGTTDDPVNGYQTLVSPQASAPRAVIVDVACRWSRGFQVYADVRNSGGPGTVSVGVLAEGVNVLGHVNRFEQVYLKAGEERSLTFQFDDVPFSGAAECQGWAGDGSEPDGYRQAVQYASDVYDQALQEARNPARWEADGGFENVIGDGEIMPEPGL